MRLTVPTGAAVSAAAPVASPTARPPPDLRAHETGTAAKPTGTHATVRFP